MLRLAIRLKGALPFSPGEKVAGEARRMRGTLTPCPSPVGEGGRAAGAADE
jgi:hypothetical protein